MCVCVCVCVTNPTNITNHTGLIFSQVTLLYSDSINDLIEMEKTKSKSLDGRWIDRF